MSHSTILYLFISWLIQLSNVQQDYKCILSLSLSHGIYQIYKYIICVCNMPNLDPWVNQNDNDYENTATKTIINKFENHLLSIRVLNAKK